MSNGNNLGTVSTTSSVSGSHTHSVSVSSTGTSGVNANLPPYYALAFIIKD